MAFIVDLKKSIWDQRNTLVPLLFSDSHDTNSETFVVGKLISLFLAITSSDDVAIEEEDVFTEDAVDIVTGKLVVRFKYPDVDIRRTLVDFCRCFPAGSIAEGTLRDGRSVNCVERLVFCLHSFAQCSHQTVNCVGPVCETCAASLLSLRKTTEAIVPSASRLARALAEFCVNRSRRNIRRLADTTADVLQKSLYVEMTSRSSLRIKMAPSWIIR